MKILKLVFGLSGDWGYPVSLGGWQVFFRYGITFALIGPVLSFYSITTQTGHSWQKALLYSITTYILDLAVVVVFSAVLSKILKIPFSKMLSVYTVVNIPIWLSDIVDIYQPARILSSVGLLYSFVVLFRGLNFLRGEGYILACVLHIILYTLNSLVAEMIVANPILAKLIQ
ncbi:MAG: hypothetical protein GXO45_01640 [Aquificae bacterium]|nr:hypothetical protein [Aquificota bacterium]